MTSSIPMAQLKAWAQRPVSPFSFRQLLQLSKGAPTKHTHTVALPAAFARLFGLGRHENTSAEERAAHVGAELATRLAKATLAMRGYEAGPLSGQPTLSKAATSYSTLLGKMDSLLKPQGASYHVTDLQALHGVMAQIPNELGDDFKLLRTGFQDWLTSKNGPSRETKVTAMTPILDASYFFNISTRLLASHYLAGQARALGQEEGYKSHLPYLVAEWNLANIAEETAEDAIAINVEKHGNSPLVEVEGEHGLTLLCCEPYVHFVLMELAKNAITAVIEKNGRAFDVDFCPPIRMVVSSQGPYAQLQIIDQGNGITGARSGPITDYFYTTKPYEEPNYHNSANFGSAIRGYGMGLPLARQYALLHGGDVRVDSTPGRGTIVTITLLKEGGNDLAGGWQ